MCEMLLLGGLGIGPCQCIFSLACLKLLLPCYSAVHPTVIIGTLYLCGTVVWLYY